MPIHFSKHLAVSLAIFLLAAGDSSFVCLAGTSLCRDFFVRQWKSTAFSTEAISNRSAGLLGGGAYVLSNVVGSTVTMMMKGTGYAKRYLDEACKGGTALSCATNSLNHIHSVQDCKSLMSEIPLYKLTRGPTRML